MQTSSTPSFFEFNPKKIPYQYRVIHDVETKFNYNLGPHYLLLSGSVGSAKSALMAWLIIRHCTQFTGACALIGRKAMPDLKDTIFQKILEMLDNSFVEDVDYVVNLTETSIKFSNGSEIISRSWHDKKYTKFRSLELSFMAIEELTENDKKDWRFFNECIARLGRRPHVPQNIFIAATNPDSPDHPAHKFFIQGATRSGYTAHKGDTIHTYFSLTEHNPFLPKWYIEGLKEKYDAKLIRRMLYGEWLHIHTDVIFHQYDPEIHYRLENTKPDVELPLRLTFDFNIRKGKPMSSALAQYNPRARSYIFIDEVAVEGARTLDACEEWAGKGYFDLPHNPEIIIHGDATGTKGDSRGVVSDYDIIEKYLANYRRKDRKPINYVIQLPSRNPPLRERHNTANGLLRNAKGLVRVFIDKRCKMVNEGFTNTRLKENAGYLEDETTEGQDISTAVTYLMHYVETYGHDTETEDITFS